MILGETFAYARQIAGFGQGCGEVLRILDEVDITDQVGEPEARRTPLPDPGEFTRTPHLEIRFRDSEPIVAFAHDLESSSRVVAYGFVGKKHAPRPALAPSHSSAKLVELRESKPLRRLDHHGRGLRNVHPDLDNGRCKQDLQRTVAESRRDVFTFGS